MHLDFADPVGSTPARGQPISGPQGVARRDPAGPPSDLRYSWMWSWVNLAGTAYLLDGQPPCWGPALARGIAEVLKQSRPENARSCPRWMVCHDGGEVFVAPGGPFPRPVVAVFPRSLDAVRMGDLWTAHRQGARAAWFRELNSWVRIDLKPLLALRLVQAVARRVPFGLTLTGLRDPDQRLRWIEWGARLLRRRVPAVVRLPDGDLPPDEVWADHIRTDNDRAAPPAFAAPLRVVHYIGALSAGGAERQLVYTAAGQKRAGCAVRVLTTVDDQEDRGHYVPLLAEARVPMRTAGTTVARSGHGHWPWHLIEFLPSGLHDPVRNLLAELAAAPIDVLHCWLDHPNLAGVAAGLIAGVPRIVLGTRNSNPTNFPRLLEPYMRTWYRLAASSRRVSFIANSRSGALSYADWIGIPAERFQIVRNGFETSKFPVPEAATRAAARRLFGLPARVPVVCGVFRLAAEKQPLLFLDVVRRVRREIPPLQVLLAGVGDLEGQLRALVERQGLTSWFRLLGRRADVANVFLAADVSLLTSTLEGCPNAALEAQFLGVPIVATDGGGTADVIRDGLTGFLCGVTDAPALAGRLIQLLHDDALRMRMAGAGPPFIRATFGLQNMLDATRAVYELDTHRPGLLSGRNQ